MLTAARRSPQGRGQPRSTTMWADPLLKKIAPYMATCMVRAVPPHCSHGRRGSARSIAAPQSLHIVSIVCSSALPRMTRRGSFCCAPLGTLVTVPISVPSAARRLFRGREGLRTRMSDLMDAPKHQPVCAYGDPPAGGFV